MDLQNFHNFEVASRKVLSFLKTRFGFDLWLIARTSGEDWIVLQALDDHYGISPGAVFPWADTFCSRMVEGRGPRFAVDANAISAYSEAAIGKYQTINAYVGMPIRGSNGELFGTLCGISPQEQTAFSESDKELIELLSSLLSTVLQGDLHALEESRRISQLTSEAMTDDLTGIFNRRAWNDLLEIEEDACRQFGYHAAIVIIDLDGLKEINDSMGHAAGDELLQSAARILKHSIREGDVLARLGGDEFGILCRESGKSVPESLVARIRKNLDSEGIVASIGTAERSSDAGLLAAWELADERMYREKHGK